MDIQPVLGEAERLLEKGKPFVLATVVHTKGSTPQKPGAKLLIREDGTTVGTLGGGCVEADVWAEARIILDEGGSTQVRRFVLNEDIAAKDGLVCGGTMDILIDPLREQADLLPFFHEIMAAYQGGGNRALATLAAADGSTEPSVRLFIRADGGTVGTLGSDVMDDLAVETALELMPKGRERWVETEYGARFYVETFTNPSTIFIAGGGHVGKAVYTLAIFLGFKVVIIDDRPQFANEDRFPDAAEIVVDDFDKGIRGLEIAPNSYVLIATRGHKFDDLALLEAAKTNAGYIGLLGSRRKAALIYRDLLKKGVPLERIKQIRAPVGLDVGGRSPEEIAVSILSEILAVKYGRDGGSMTVNEAFVEKAKQLADRKPGRHRAAAAS